MAGVKWYGEGVFHRETVRGDGQSARWIWPLVPGVLIYNRLFAWKASFAVVPADLADCHVSNEFPQFMPDPAELLPEYLYLWCITDQTIRAVNAASTGSSAVSRNRFRDDFFLDFEIPLPPLSVQRKIVAAWEAATEVRGGHGGEDRTAGTRNRITTPGRFGIEGPNPIANAKGVRPPMVRDSPLGRHNGLARAASYREV